MEDQQKSKKKKYRIMCTNGFYYPQKFGLFKWHCIGAREHYSSLAEAKWVIDKDKLAAQKKEALSRVVIIDYGND